MEIVVREESWQKVPTKHNGRYELSEMNADHKWTDSSRVTSIYGHGLRWVSVYFVMKYAH